MSFSPRTRAARHAAPVSIAQKLVVFIGSLSLMLIGLVGTAVAMSAPASAVGDPNNGPTMQACHNVMPGLGNTGYGYDIQPKTQVAFDNAPDPQNWSWANQDGSCGDGPPPPPECQPGEVTVSNSDGSKDCKPECPKGEVSVASGSEGGDDCKPECPKGDASLSSTEGDNDNCKPECPTEPVLISGSTQGGGDEGRCKYTATAEYPLSLDICVTTEGGKSNQTVSVLGEGSGESHKSQADAQDKADKAAQKDAEDKLAAALEGLNYTEGKCVWDASTTVTASLTFCNMLAVPAAMTTVSEIGGSGPITSTISQADADQKALAAATDAANSKLSTALAAYPSKFVSCPTPGGSTPPDATPVVTPATIVAPATVTPVVTPVTPEAGTVPAKPAKPAKKPATVTTPEKATVPSAVPAGGGSSAPGVPMWALAMLAIGAVGAIGAGSRLIGARTK